MFDTTLPALVLVSVGCAVAGLGLLLRGRQIRRLAGSSPVPGEIVDEVHGLDSTWVPVIRFLSVDGTEVTGTPRTSSWHGISRVGRQVVVYPDPVDPRRFDALGAGLGREGSVVLLASLMFLVPGLAVLLLR